MRTLPALRRITTTFLVLLAVLLGACGDSDDDDAGPTTSPSTTTATTAPPTTAAAAACGADEAEPVDPASANHVLQGAPEPTYLTDPPTSGPHEPGPVRSGVLDAPLTRPQQVGQLEAGGVLIQHGDLPPDELAALEALGGDAIAIAPNAALPAAVVATAWTHKVLCDGVDVEALAAFAADHVGGGPGTDG